MIHVTCPGCGKVFRLRDRYAGSTGRCPRCNSTVHVTPPPPEAPAETPLAAASASVGQVQAVMAMTSSPPAAGAWPDQTLTRPEALLPPLPMPGAAPQQGHSHIGEIAKPKTAAQMRSAKLAKWSLVTGFVALPVPGFEIAAVTFGVLALNNDDDELDTHNSTRGKAKAGIVLGVVAFLMHLLALIVALLLALLLPQSRQQASPPPATNPVAIQAQNEGPASITPSGKRSATPPPRRTGQMWYYDLNSGQLFTGNVLDIAPIDAPSGRQPNGRLAGVKAYIFTYGDCADESQRFVGWLERATPAAKKLAEQGITNPNAAVQNLSVDELIGVLTVPLEVSEDARSWQRISPVQYLSWKNRKRQAMVQNGVPAKPCLP